MSEQFDVVIGGGGMVGLALASLLPSDLSIAVVDGQPWQRVTQLDDAVDQRVSAISPRSQQILSASGAWASLPSARLTPYQRMVVWESDGCASLTFAAEEMAAANLGHIIENRVLRAALYQTLESQRHIHWFNATISDIELQEPMSQLALSDGTLLSTRLLVGADGARSQIRQQLRISTAQHDYQQQALVATISTEKPHQYTAWQRFLATGPIAYLPLFDQHQCSIVWSMAESQLAEFLTLSLPQQQQAIGRALGFELGAIKLQSPLRSFPLVAQHAAHYTKPGVALIGDAAHAIHPLAGQGVNLGFSDAQQLADVLIDTRSKGHSVAHYPALRAFERARKGENYLMQKAMTALNWAYSQQSLPLSALRNIAVRKLQNTPQLKRQFMRRAMGEV
ncbi:MAG: FAD-dependent monooxygenase [Gammaproteobacteria bacterium]|nr:FAD-dependent monooxygenase [Gammaproteobacteria bacterium]